MKNEIKQEVIAELPEYFHPEDAIDLAIQKTAEEIFEDFDCFVGKCGHEKEYAILKKKWGVK